MQPGAREAAANSQKKADSPKPDNTTESAAARRCLPGKCQNGWKRSIYAPYTAIRTRRKQL